MSDETRPTCEVCDGDARICEFSAEPVRCRHVSCALRPRKCPACQKADEAVDVHESDDHEDAEIAPAHLEAAWRERDEARAALIRAVGLLRRWRDWFGGFDVHEPLHGDIAAAETAAFLADYDRSHPVKP